MQFPKAPKLILVTPSGISTEVKFSQLSKGEILNSHLQRERIIHRDGWEREINKLLSN